MSTATRATGSRSLTAWSFGPFATVPSYQNRGRDHASVRAAPPLKPGHDHGRDRPPIPRTYCMDASLMQL